MQTIPGSPIAKSVPEKLRAHIQHWDDERSLGNSLIVSLKDGVKFSDDPQSNCHVEGFDTVKDAIAALRSVMPCLCESCAENLHKTLGNLPE